MLMRFVETEESKQIAEFERVERALASNILQVISGDADFKRIVEKVSMQSPSSTERCLFCLAISPKGLTPLEMSKKIYLRLPAANHGARAHNKYLFSSDSDFMFHRSSFLFRDKKEPKSAPIQAHFSSLYQKEYAYNNYD